MQAHHLMLLVQPVQLSHLLVRQRHQADHHRHHQTQAAILAYLIIIMILYQTLQRVMQMMLLDQTQCLLMVSE